MLIRLTQDAGIESIGIGRGALETERAGGSRVAPFWRRGLVGLLAGLLALTSACAGSPGSGPGTDESRTARAANDSAPSDATASKPSAAYRLGSGDKLRVIVFGEEDLSGEFEVDDTGAVSLPLVGQIDAGGQTLRRFEAAVRARLSEGYLKDPRVSVQVLNYRPFYIIGEIEKGGEYPFVSGMHILNAVAVAGGFTYRANSGKVFITRGGEELELEVSPELRLEPGDVIRVPERFF